MRIHCCTLFLGIVFLTQVDSSNGEVSLTEPPRVAAYKLDVTFSPRQNALQAGKAQIQFYPFDTETDTLIFFLHGELKPDSVKIGETPLTIRSEPVFYAYDYSFVATRTVVKLKEKMKSAELSIWYSGHFYPSRARSMSDYMRIDSEGVFLRAYGYSLWFPIFLESGQESYKVAFTDVTLRSPAAFFTVFTGSLIDDQIQNGERVTRWQADSTDLFDAQCTARKFTVRQDDDLFVYALPDSNSQQAAERILDFSRKVTMLYRKHYRRTASRDQMHVAQLPQYGDISSGNMVGITDGNWRDFEVDSRAGRVLAHEIVHPFVQVPVAMADSLYALVTEGSPSYFYLPVLEELFDEQWYNSYIRSIHEAYLRKRETGIDHHGRQLPPQKPLFAIQPDEIGVYKDRFLLNDRSLLFWDYIRRHLGKARFFDFTRDLCNHPQLDQGTFIALLNSYLPDRTGDLLLWLRTTNYPRSFWPLQ